MGMQRKYPPLETRFWRKVAIAGDNECHEWTGMRNVVHRYGLIYEDAESALAAGRPKRLLLAHRVAYELEHGPLPANGHRWHVHHTCENRGCVNHRHLELLENQTHNRTHGTSASAMNAVKTHCKHGHEFTPENTILRAKGGRKCRECNRAWCLRHYHDTKAPLRQS